MSRREMFGHGLTPAIWACLVGAPTGAALHQLFRRVELDRHPLMILSSFIASQFILTSLVRTQHENFTDAFVFATSVVGASIISLWFNILVYRAWYHPVRTFPGPFGARLSKFWALGQVVKSGVRWYQVAGRLKKEYGDFVRTGPREILIFDAEAIPILLGGFSKSRKGPFYGALEESLHVNRDHERHKQRRKVWDLAFKQSLADYGPSVEEFTDSLLLRIQRDLGNPIVINDLAMHYSYDVMSSLAFGNSTKFLEAKNTDISKKVLQAIQDGFGAVGGLVHVPWLLTIVECISWVGPIVQIDRWSAEQVEKRRHIKNPRPDIMGHLIQHAGNTPKERRLLNSESRLIITAGSDTTSSALTSIFILLAAHPEYQEQLREEIDIAFQLDTYSSAKSQPILDSIINESLRLYPPTLFATQRVTPAEGVSIGDVYIPPDTVVGIAAYQIHHDSRYFVFPDSFIPERWTSKPDLVINNTAFIPFSTGPYNCVGKSLAWMELRSVIARTVRAYSIGFPESVKFIEGEFFAGTRDHFTAGIPRCELVFRERGSD